MQTQVNIILYIIQSYLFILAILDQFYLAVCRTNEVQVKVFNSCSILRKTLRVYPTYICFDRAQESFSCLLLKSYHLINLPFAVREQLKRRKGVKIMYVQPPQVE